MGRCCVAQEAQLSPGGKGCQDGGDICMVLVGDLVAKLCLTLMTPWTVACQTPLSMGFPRQEYWSSLPFPSPGDLPEPGIEPVSLSCFSGGFFSTEPPGKPRYMYPYS